MADHNELGELGETLAAAYLQNKKYTILERNWTWKKDEIDIIATDGTQLIIVEVKTRKDNIPVDPRLSITRAKQRRVIRAAHQYILEKECTQEVRLDVMIVRIIGQQTDIVHIEGAFYPLA